jgi:hypothetical protein
MKPPCFILAHKYIRGYTSFIQLYINNIRAFYGVQALILVVDNQSAGLEDVFPPNNTHDSQVIILQNDGQINGFYDVGAYIFGLKWLIKQGRFRDYEYFVFSQDTYINIQPLDFGGLVQAELWACPVVSCFPGQNSLANQHPHCADVRTILEGLRPRTAEGGKTLYDYRVDAPLCFANTFLVHQSRIFELYYYIKDFCLIYKPHMEIYERVLPCILCDLNEGRSAALDGLIPKNGHFSVPSKYFVKFCQAKK